MPNYLEPEEFLKQSTSGVIFDVRSESEYEQGHIPSALSMPLFDDTQRAAVGTTYVKIGKEQAVLQGLEFVGPKLKKFAKTALKAARKQGVDHIYMYCWRGGMRSGSMAWLIEQVGLKVYLLKGGYKAYREEGRRIMESDYQLTVLGGNTGSGKTDILKRMAEHGQQVIDLEGLANHKGSAFGAMGQDPQPSSEQFENLLVEKLRSMDLTRPIWVEGESMSIGTVFIPQLFFVKMSTSKVIILRIPFEIRAERLTLEYGAFNTELLANSFEKIRKRLGFDKHKLATEALEAGDIATACRIALEYYDKHYLFDIKKRDVGLIREVSFDCFVLDTIVTTLIEQNTIE